MNFTRRNFLTTAALSSASVALGTSAQGNAQTDNKSPMNMDSMPGMKMGHEKTKRPDVPRLPALICRMTNTESVDAAYELLTKGSDPLDAALHLTSTQESNPDDFTSGLGALPNEDGEVQLDAAVWHGPTRRAAAVASVSGIKNASLLAQAVMRHTGHSLLTAADAQRFALAHGFTKEDLATARSRAEYSVWKQLQKNPPQIKSAIYDPNWLDKAKSPYFLSTSEKDFDVLIHNTEPLAVKAGIIPQYTWKTAFDTLFPLADPLYVGTISSKKELASAATTSGQPWRMAGAASDIAILGAGTCLDPEVGSVGATGNGEANIRVGGARVILENMRKGMSPDNAGLDALSRIAHWYKNDMAALKFVEVVYYILRNDGAYSCVSLWRGDRTGHMREFTIHDGVRRAERCLFLYDGNVLLGCGECKPLSVKAMHDLDTED